MKQVGELVLVGYAAIIYDDSPARRRQEGGFVSVSLPMTRDYLNYKG